MDKHHRLALSLAIVGLLTSVLSACSSSSGDQGGGSLSPDAQAYVSQAKAFVAAHLKESDFQAGSAYTPTPGKTIGIVSAAQTNPITALIAANMQAAATAVGWKTILVDGKGSPAGWDAAMRQLIQQNVDGIFNDAIADSAVPAALTAAAAANIPVVSMAGGTLLASKPVDHPSIVAVDLPYKLMGQVQGNYLVAASNGTAKVAFLTNHLLPALAQLIDAEENVVKQCAGCKILDTSEININANVTPAVATQTQSLLSKYGQGKINYFVPPLDFMTAGATQALTASGRSDVKLLSNGCNPGVTPGLDQIRKGGPTVFCDVPDNAWFGWAAVDQMGRHFAGLPTKSFELPLPFFTTDNLTSSTPESVFKPFDYVSYYKKLWSVE